MKRAPLPVILLALMAAAAAGAAPSEDPLSWLNRIRGGAVQTLGMDTILMETAQAYAGQLAALGRISHIGPDGSDALTRCLRMGGTSARVGEIIGAGASLSGIEAAWLQSPDHRAEIFRPYWTQTGWGVAYSGDEQVWVVLFVQKRVDELTVIEQGDGAMMVEGRLLVSDAVKPVLLSGLLRIDAVAWNRGSGRFLFLVSREEWTGYVRLGYLSTGRELVITDVLTSPRGTGSPGAGSHS
jgi:hypothetical protein